jgi:hypothetical protein
MSGYSLNTAGKTRDFEFFVKFLAPDAGPFAYSRARPRP